MAQSFGEKMAELMRPEPEYLGLFELWELFVEVIGHDNLVRQVKRKTRIKSITYDEYDSSYLVEYH